MIKNINKVLPNHLAIYIRVSTEKQVIEGISADNQLNKGIEKALDLGWSYSVYDDRGMSGSISYYERPGIKRLIQDLENNNIGGLYCFDIDRLSRDADYIEPQVLITKFSDAGIKIFTNSGEIDLANSGVALTARLKGLFASFERLQTKERVKSALTRSMKNGNNAGGGQLVLYGYDRVDKKLVINAEQAIIVKRIYQYYLEGHGTKVIANLLNEAHVPTKRNSIADGKMAIKRCVTNKKTGDKEVITMIKDGSEFVWRDTTIYNILKNTTYIGQKKWQDIVVASPIIIDELIYNQVQELLKEKMKLKRAPYTNVGKRVNQFLLKGKIRCATCGRSYYGHKRADLRDKAYKCLSQRYKNEYCGNRGIDIDYLDNLIWNSLMTFDKQILKTIQGLSKLDKWQPVLIKDYKQVIAKNSDHILSLTKKFNEGLIKQSVYEKLLKDYENIIEDNKNFIASINNDNVILANKDAIIDTTNHFIKSIKEATTFEEKQGMIRATIKEIVVYSEDLPNNRKQQILVYYKFGTLTPIYLKNSIDIKYKNNWQRVCSEMMPLEYMESADVGDGEIKLTIPTRIIKHY